MTWNASEYNSLCERRWLLCILLLMLECQFSAVFHITLCRYPNLAEGLLISLGQLE